MKPAIFLDRDNTLTVDEGYCHKVEDFAWMPEADKALRIFHEAGLPVFIVTNQGGIARGIFDSQEMQAFHDHLCAQAKQAGGMITDIAFCPHHPKADDEDMRICSCRKPDIGLFTLLAAKWQIDLNRSVMIGDRDTDIIAGETAGCHAYLYDKSSSLAALAQQIIDAHFNDKSGSL